MTDDERLLLIKHLAAGADEGFLRDWLETRQNAPLAGGAACALPSPPPPIAAAGAPSQARYRVIRSALSGPTPSSQQQYLNFYLERTGRKLVLRFLLNSLQEAAWKGLLADFFRACGVEPEDGMDSDILNRREVTLTEPGAHLTTLSGLASIGVALGMAG